MVQKNWEIPNRNIFWCWEVVLSKIYEFARKRSWTQSSHVLLNISFLRKTQPIPTSDSSFWRHFSESLRKIEKSRIGTFFGIEKWLWSKITSLQDCPKPKDEMNGFERTSKHNCRARWMTAYQKAFFHYVSFQKNWKIHDRIAFWSKFAFVE